MNTKQSSLCKDPCVSLPHEKVCLLSVLGKFSHRGFIYTAVRRLSLKLNSPVVSYSCLCSVKSQGDPGTCSVNSCSVPADLMQGSWHLSEMHPQHALKEKNSHCPD